VIYYHNNDLHFMNITNNADNNMTIIEMLSYYMAVCQLLTERLMIIIGADSMGAMGGIAPRPKSCGGDAPKSPPQEF